MELILQISDGTEFQRHRADPVVEKWAEGTARRIEGGEGDGGGVKEFRFKNEKQNLNINSGPETCGGVEEPRSADGVLGMI